MIGGWEPDTAALSEVGTAARWSEAAATFPEVMTSGNTVTTRTNTLLYFTEQLGFALWDKKKTVKSFVIFDRRTKQNNLSV